MADAPRPTVTPILPCNDLDAAESWWNRLGFTRPEGQDYPGYRILFDEAGASLHLAETPAGWLVPGHNPFGVYIYTPRVAAIAEAMAACVVGRPAAPEHKPWGLYEVALNGPDGVLVRIGWPSALARSL